MSGACVGLYASVFVSVTSNTCLKAPSGFPPYAGCRLNSLTWPMKPCVSIPPPGLCTHCILYLLHSPRSSPITLHGLYSYPVFLEPHPRLGQTAPTLTGFPRSLSWAITDISVWSAHVPVGRLNHYRAFLLEMAVPQVRTGSVRGPGIQLTPSHDLLRECLCV